MISIKQKLVLETTSKSVRIGHDFKNYDVTHSKIMIENEDHSLTKFNTITNLLDCEITINCGIEPPQIFFKFQTTEELIEINHNYQTKVIKALKELK